METFKDFWEFYLTQHTNKINKWMHVVGTLIAIGLLIYSLFFDSRLILFSPLIGYGFAWTGHFVFEKNKPATFKYPLRSLLADLKLTWVTLFCLQK